MTTGRAVTGERPTTGERGEYRADCIQRLSGPMIRCFQIERELGDGPMEPLYLSDRRRKFDSMVGEGGKVTSGS